MKRLLGLILSLWMMVGIPAAFAWNDSTGTRSKNESTSTDAASSVLYGKYGTSIVPLQVDADGKVVTSGGAGGVSSPFTMDVINGGTAANNDITIQGTTDSTRTTSYVNLQPNGGNVGIGKITNPTTTLEIEYDENTTEGINPRGFLVSSFDATEHSVHLTTRKAHGTRLLPTSLVAGDYLGAFISGGYNGIDWDYGSYIAFLTQSVSANKISSYLALSTMDAGVGRENFFINSTGRVCIGFTKNFDNILNIVSPSGVNSSIKLRTGTSSSGATSGLDIISEETTNMSYIIQRENADLVFRTNNIDRAYIKASGNVDIGGTAAPAKLSLTLNSANTATIQEMQRITTTSTGTVAANFGASLDTYLEDASGNVAQQASSIATIWTVPTHTGESSAVTVSVVMGGGAIAEVARFSGGGLVVPGKISSTANTVTVANAATTFAIVNDVVTVTGDGAGNTVATITGGVSGQTLKLIFADDKVTITDTDAATANTVNLSAAFTSSANDVMTLVNNGTKWFEVSRSVN
jgi:hypothetical protein